ncbi:hypothetical protein GCM10028796_52100 [Ramlibacter monticola]
MAEGLMGLLQSALSARSRVGWSRWLHGEIQHVLPHDALIAAWGDVRTGDFAYDVITCTPALPIDAFPRDIIVPLMGTLFEQWLAADQNPVAVDTRSLRSVGSALFSRSPRALIHGVQDYRSRHDCIYVFVGPDALSSPVSRRLFRIALPYIDTAFRQLSDRGQKDAEQDLVETGFTCSIFADGPFTPETAHTVASPPTHAAPVLGESAPGSSPLSARELEIMKWVRMGKTNSEIAMILNLSTFTVKNHMRRIYRKLDVLNRAQAVGSLEGAYATSAYAGR